MNNSLTVGFIGLGNMGFPMATHLIKKGFSLIVYDVRPEPLDKLKVMGAKIADSPRLLAQDARIILVSLPGSKELKIVILGKEGVLAGSHEETLILDFSTVDPQTVIDINGEINQKPVRLIDAPVSGGTKNAGKGKLTIMIGATQDEVKEVMSILKALGEKLFFVGTLGGGATAKLINNYVAMCNMVVLAEAMNIAEKMGSINMDTLYEIMTNSSANSYLLQTRIGDRVLKNKYSGGFSVDLGLKDIGLALEMSKHLSVPRIVGTISSEMFRTASRMGYGNDDMASLYRLVQKMSASD